MSLHANCETFVETCELLRIRQEMRHQSPTGWGSRAEAITAVGARLYNQVCCRRQLPACVCTCLQRKVSSTCMIKAGGAVACHLQH